MTRVLAAATAALGVAPTDVQELSRRRSLVLRARAGKTAAALARTSREHRLGLAPAFR